MREALHISRYFENNTWLRKENANQNISYSNLKGFVANEAMKEYTLAKYPKEIRELHQDAYVHIHDLANGIVPYCNGIDFQQLLEMGLITGRVVSKPPKHLDTALNQLVNRFGIQQQEWAGAQAANDFNTLLAPFVAVDSMNYKSVKQAMQRFVWDSSYPTRSGYETVFSNIMLNTKCPSYLEEISPLWHPNDTYADFHDESMMILRALNEVYSEGDAKGNPFTFPIPTINVLKSTKFEGDVWNEIFDTVARYGTYYFMNYKGSGIVEGSKRAMCCKFIVDYEQLAETGGRWALEGNTGSVGVVTINMAKIGFLAKDETELFELFDRLLKNSVNSLLIKSKWCNEMLENGYLPVTKIYGINFDRYFRTIGLIGLNEMCVNFLGQPLSKSKPFIMKVMEHLNDFLRKTQVQTKLFFNGEQTPGEGAATRLALVDRKLHPGIFTQGVPEAPYYTTVLIPVNEYVPLVERIRIEQDILREFSGGSIFRINLGEAYPSPEALAKLTDRIATNSRIAYFDWSSIFSICQKCGQRINGKEDKCDNCGGKTKTFARIVGYYSDISRANIGKAQEISDRLHYRATF